MIQYSHVYSYDNRFFSLHLFLYTRFLLSLVLNSSQLDLSRPPSARPFGAYSLSLISIVQIHRRSYAYRLYLSRARRLSCASMH